MVWWLKLNKVKEVQYAQLSEKTQFDLKDDAFNSA